MPSAAETLCSRRSAAAIAVERFLGDTMGSTGSGSFSDYSGRPNEPAGNGSSAGGSSGNDRCRQAFAAGLEDVAQYDFYSTTRTVPPAGTVLTLVHRGRIVAVDQNGTSVGALPTRFNYLAACLHEGFSYRGVVNSSTLTPTPQVNADFAAQ